MLRRSMSAMLAAPGLTHLVVVIGEGQRALYDALDPLDERRGR